MMVWDLECQNITLQHWEHLGQELPLHLIDAVLGRYEAGLADWFVPTAWGVGVASDTLLGQIGYRHGMRRPSGWIERGAGSFFYPLNRSLYVRGFEESPFWAISRRNPSRMGMGDDVLGLEFGWTPILTRTYQAAMQLAMHCHTKNVPAGLRWINTEGNVSNAACEIARQRRHDLACARQLQVHVNLCEVAPSWTQSHSC